MNNTLYRKILIKCFTWGYKEKECKNPIRTRIKQETKKEIKDNMGE